MINVSLKMHLKRSLRFNVHPRTLFLLVSHSVLSNSSRSHGLQHARLPCPSPSLGICSNSCPLSRWFHPIISPSPPAFNLSQHQGLFQWVSSSHQVTKVLVFLLQHQSFQWIFKVDFLKDWLVWSPWSPKDSQKSLLQYHNLKASIFSAQHPL